jgi:GNAT superfamily N-acetyltransferase
VIPPVEHVIRRATAGDLTAVAELVAEAYEPWVAVIGARPAPMDADYAGLIADGRVHLAGTDALDGLVVLISESDALLVENVAVRPALHGRGIGRRLLAFAEDEARRLGLPAVRLYTNAKMTRNIVLYEALGYAVTGRMPVEDRGQIVLMRKVL